jgi:hypothetical protein
MVNSRGLAEQLAKVWGEPVTEVRQHARNLRESDPPLITAGGRGRHVPDMTADDAASLICATLGSRAVGDSASTVIGLKRLTANYRGSRVKPMDHVAGIVHRFIGSRLDMAKAPDVVQGLARVLELFEHETELQRELLAHADMDYRLFARFRIHYPDFYAHLTIGVRGKFHETVTYGRYKNPVKEAIRGCDERSLREIAKWLR